jgi:cytochrome c-type biogenesis protein CcmH/NrfG
VTIGTDETSSTPAASGTAPRSAGFRLALLVVLVALLLGSAGALVWLLAERRGQADQLQSERESVMSTTEQFVLRLNTYGPDQLDAQGHLTDYRKKVAEVITPKFDSDFETNGLPIAEKMVAQAGYARTAKVFGVGVESIDADSATAIVAAGLTGTYPDPKHPQDAAKRLAAPQEVARWEVDLVKTGGTWLVDDYSPVTGGGGQ